MFKVRKRRQANKSNVGIYPPAIRALKQVFLSLPARLDKPQASVKNKKPAKTGFLNSGGPFHTYDLPKWARSEVDNGQKNSAQKKETTPC